MSTKKRYEEIDEQFNDLPMPDQEASWQKMKELLEDDDDDIIPPPIFFRSCLGWGFLLVGLIALWLIIRPEKWLREDSKTERISSSDKTRKPAVETTIVEKKKPSSSPGERMNQNHPVVPKPLEANPSSRLPKTNKPGLTMLHPLTIKKPPSERSKEKVVVPERKKQVELSPDETEKSLRITTNPQDRQTDTPSLRKNNEVVPENRGAEQNTNPDSSGQKRIIDSALQKKIHPKRKFVVAAGIGEQQQIPIAGQTAVPYSSYGRKGSLADYIPSLFVRMQKRARWFVQGEFRYGAAQSVREFSFARKTKYDTSSFDLTTTTQRLKKTYYHQLPFSFNYYLQPNLSVGAGGIYSHFYRAVTEHETRIQNALTGTQTVVKQIIPIRHFTDSFLYKTQLHVLLQADYQWRKFSFGLRYTRDVQPYIKYTKPDGTIDEEKNQTLQFIIRYNLWQSKRG